MKRRALLLSLPALAACTPSLATFDTFAPRDRGVARVLRDAAFGPNPRQKLDLYAPARAIESLPIIVFIYGGSWRYGDKGDYNFWALRSPRKAFSPPFRTIAWCRRCAFPVLSKTAPPPCAG